MVSVDADRAPGTGARRRSTPALAVIIAMAVLVIVLDQLTKWWAVSTLADRDIDLFWTLRFHLIENHGSAFSLTESTGPLLSVIAVVVVAVMLRSGRALESRPVLVGYGLVIGGSLGNVVDRLFRAGDGFLGGGVIDFVDPQWFPIFNLADAAITIGIGLLLIVLLRDPDALEPRSG